MPSQYELSDQDLAHIRNAPWGPRYLSYVDRQAWSELSFDEEVCTALKNAYEHHCQLLVEAIPKGAQIETAVRTDPPCRL